MISPSDSVMMWCSDKVIWCHLNALRELKGWCEVWNITVTVIHFSCRWKPQLCNGMGRKKKRKKTLKKTTTTKKVVFWREECNTGMQRDIQWLILHWSDFAEINVVMSVSDLLRINLIWKRHLLSYDHLDSIQSGNFTVTSVKLKGSFHIKDDSE